MLEEPLQIHLEQTDQHSSRFTLTCDTLRYTVTLNPEAITFSDWLRRLRLVLAGHNDSAGDRDPQDLLRNVGVRLWQGLIPEGAPAQEREALAHALRTGHTPLLLDLPDTLAGLPWELLCDPEQSDEKGFLACRRPLVRLSTSVTPKDPVEPPLRLLLLISSPPSLGEDSRVDVESERAVVEQATHDMRESGYLHLVIEDIVTLKRVEHLLNCFKPHIIHYIGHGEYDQTNGGMLLWEDDQGNVLPLSASRIASLLRSRNLHAVVLHGCETAKGDARAEVQSLADSLVQEGLPAVLAQQANFTYESSQLASHMWYQALVSGQSMAQALLSVRQALIKADRPDWAVPILQGCATSLTPVLDVSSSIPGSPDPLLTRRGAAADLPTPTDAFVGRHRELRALHLILEDTSESSPTLALITGPGGMGKSTLVSQAVTRYGGSYKAALILRCQQYQSIDLFLQSIGALLKRLGTSDFLDQTLPDPKRSTEAKIDEAVAALNVVGPVILIIDNLESMQNEEQLISDKGLLYLLQKLLTNLRGGRVLITGRSIVKELLLQEHVGTRFLHLGLEDLSPYETSQLLLRYPPLARLSKPFREMLTRDFGGLPYVYDLLSSKAAVENLEQIIYQVRQYGAETYKAVDQERKQEEWQKVHSRVVEFATLEAIINRLSEASRTLLAQLGILHQSFPLAAIEDGLKAQRPVWQPLFDWSLLHYDPYEKSYHLHDITRCYAEGLLDEHSRKQTQAQLATWYEHYADQDSHNLADYLEAHRLLRTTGDVQGAGELVMQLAEVLRRFGLYSLLRKLCIATLNDIRESNELLAASLLHMLGTIAFAQGDHPEARRLYQQGLEISERLRDQGWRANFLGELGTLALRQGNYPEARWFYQQCLATFKQLGDQSGQATTLHQLGTIAQDQGNYLEARQFYLQSLEIKEQLGNQSGQATSLGQLGTIAYAQGNYPEALWFYQQSLEIEERLGDQRGQAINLRQLGMIAHAQGDYLEARQLYQQSLAICERLGDQSEQTATLHHLGMIAQDQGDYPEARQFYQQSLEISERLGNQRERAATLHQLGMIARDQGDYPEARRLYQQSLKIEKQLGNQSGQATSLGELGIIAQLQGNYSEAHWFYRQSLAIFERLGEQSGQATTLYQLGTLAYMRGDFENALTPIVQAYILLDTLRSPFRHDALRTLASIRDQMGEEQFAIRWQAVAGGRLFPTLDTEDTDQQQAVTFLWELSRLCDEVVVILRIGNAEQREALATQIEQILKNGSPMEGAQDFLMVLLAWLREQDTQLLAEKLQSPFRETHAQMVAVVEQEKTQDADKDNALTLEKLPGVVSSVILSGTVEQRQQLATGLAKAQQQLSPEAVPLRRFFGCLAAALRGETQEAALLEAPFTELWQEFQDALSMPSAESSQKEEGKHD